MPTYEEMGTTAAEQFELKVEDLADQIVSRLDRLQQSELEGIIMAGDEEALINRIYTKLKALPPLRMSDVI